MLKRGKKGAVELSVGTIVILVLAMTMLIMGIVLIRGIFKGATYNVAVLNEKVRGEINKLFTEDDKLVVYLADNIAKVEQGGDYGVAFGIKNLETGTMQVGIFSSEVVISNPSEVQSKCGISSSAVENWMTGSSEANIPISPGQAGYGLVRFNVPKTAPLCTIRFRINIKKDNQPYATGFFDLKITS